MARTIHKCNHCAGGHVKMSAAKRCAKAAKRRQRAKAWTDKELGV
jgi:hypothetical protein